MARPAAFTLQSEGTDPKEMEKFLASIAQANGRALDAGLRACCKAATREVRRAYQRASKGVAPISRGTRQKRRVGKTAGRWPEVPTFAGRRPLYRGGLLARSVDWMKVSTYNFLVGVEPSPVPYNRPEGMRTLDGLAVMHEVGWTRTMTVTRRMHAYLMILFGKATGSKGTGGSISGSKGDEETDVGETKISVHIRPRPIWQPVFDAHAETTFFDAFVKAFHNRLRQKVGAKIDPLLAAPKL